MEYRVTFTSETPHVTVTTTGLADAATFARLNRELASDPRLHRGMTVLVDHADLDASGLSGDDVRGLGRSFGELGDAFAGVSIAIVAPAPAMFGLARMWQAHLASDAVKTRLFRTREEAVAWLQSFWRHLA